MGLANRATSLVDPFESPPAACQGAIAITARTDDARVLEALGRCQDKNARLEIEAERAFLDALDGSCRTPIGALARAGGAQMTFIGETLTPDGSQRWRREATIELTGDTLWAVRKLGHDLGDEIRNEAGDAIVLHA
jgi:hydroxymethylbilane synthase